MRGIIAITFLFLTSPSAISAIPISVWYLTFYCNPAIKLAVINKILIDGLCKVAKLYGESTEAYLYTEEEYHGPQLEATALVPCRAPLTAGYDVTSPMNVLLNHIFHIILLPIKAFKEIYILLRDSVIRDRGK